MELDLYKKMYAILCCAASDAVDLLQWVPNFEDARHLLQNALFQAEELYIISTES